MDLTWSNFGLLISVIVVSTFIWEFIGRKFKSNLKPSVGLNFAAIKSKDLFFWLGRILAQISSFYTYIEFKEFYLIFEELVRPIIKIIVSPFYLIKGYINTAIIYNHPYIVGFGSITLLAIGLYFSPYFGLDVIFNQLIGRFYEYLTITGQKLKILDACTCSLITNKTCCSPRV